MVHNKTFKLPSKDEISFLHPGSHKYPWEMVIKKHDSNPVSNKEFGHFERKSAKVSAPPRSEPFSDVYESEIEIREDTRMLDDSECYERQMVNESINEINELIDTISNATQIKSFEA